ncbi:hypothetical protein [Psychrobacillus psychrodurans]|uniref:hypothetical protein n=1 Tax=Psychrobacillus psychrodurans TaxID=126157 RepID=UPI003D07687C
MFFKKKVEMDFYCIAIFAEKDLEEDEYVQLVDRMEKIGNVEVITEMALTSESIVSLEKRFPNTEIKAPSFAVLKIDMDRVNEETKKMEKKFKWKKLFGTIHLDEYLVVEHNTMYDFTKTLLYTTNLEDVIEFLRTRSDCTKTI